MLGVNVGPTRVVLQCIPERFLGLDWCLGLVHCGFCISGSVNGLFGELLGSRWVEDLG